MPIPSKPAAAYAATSSAKDAFDRRDLGERELHGRLCNRLLQALSDRRHLRQRATWKRRLRELLVDEVAGAGAEPRARDASKRRCARDRRRESGVREPAAAGGRGSSGRARTSRRRCRRATRLTFSAAMSAGERATRWIVARSRFRMCRPRRASDAVRVRLAQLLGPGAVADVELARGVALDASGRQLLQLDPDDPGAVRARATGRPRAAGRRRSSPPPGGARARLRSPRARRRPGPGVRCTIAVRARRSSPYQSGGSDIAMWICISPRP